MKAASNPGANFSIDDVFAHNSPQNAWTTIDGKVYDLTDFLHRHPGGYHAISRAIGKDGSSVFSKYLLPQLFGSL